jgi:rod shape-determining protein MreB
VGGRDLLAAICLHIMDTYQVQVEPTVAREILHTVTAALRRDSQKAHEFYATTSAETEPQKILVSSNEIAEVIKKPLQKVAAVAGSVIKQTPTTLLSDIAENGLAVSGGVAELDYIDTFLQRELAVPVRVVEMPAEAVIRGGRKALSFISKYEQSIPVTEVNHA